MSFNNSNPQTRLHRSNFDSLPWAAFTVFQILTYDNYPAVMYDGWIAVGAWSPLYMSIVIILGVFIVMNMFSAILVQSVMDGNGDELPPPNDVDAAPHGDQCAKSITHQRRSSIGTKSVRVAKRAMRKLLRLHIVHAFQPMGLVLDGPPAHLVPRGKSLLLFSHRNPIRKFCHYILNRREYTSADRRAPPSQLRSRSIRAARRAMRMLLRLNEKNANPEDPIIIGTPTKDDVIHGQTNQGKSLMLFAHTNPIRRLCVSILNRPEYTYVMSSIIFVSCVGTALDSPLQDPTKGLGLVLDTSNLVFAVLFSTEMVLNVIARGFIQGPDAFVKDSWRLLDGFIVFVSVLPFCLGNAKSGALSGLRSLRAFRALRPLRVINKLPSLKIVVNTLFRCIPDMGRALMFAFFMLFLFGLMSLALFKGALHTCSVSPYNYGLGTGTPVNPPWFPTDYTGDFNIVNVTVLGELDVMTFPRPWTKMTDPQKDAMRPVWNQPGCGPFADDVMPTSRDICLCFANQNGTSWDLMAPQSFDNIVFAVMGLFELTTMEGWTSTCLACVDAVGENMQPIENYNPIIMVYWWLYMIICAFFITNLFIGVLCDSFTRETYGSMVTDEQIQWIKLQNKVLALAPQRVHPCPKTYPRKWCYKVSTYPYFEHFITTVIMTNTVAMAVQVFGQSVATEHALTAMNSVFSVIFTIEAVAKIGAFGRVYFDDSWNRFDFVIVVFTIVSFILQAVDINLGSAATVIRVFRVGRALRLIKKAKIMKNLFDTLIVSLPAVVNVVSLLSLLYYIFAAVAVQLFAKTAFNNSMVNENQNFQNFWTAFQTLIGFSTGENWDNFTWEMYYVKPATNPTCEDRSYNASMCGFNDTYGCVPLDGCGRRRSVGCTN
ncbi:hypothetical protein AaE_012611, partial [Aphanomyces astaci]